METSGSKPLEPSELRKQVDEALKRLQPAGTVQTALTHGKPASEAPEGLQNRKTSIVNLEKLEPHRDLIALVGFVAVVGAIGHFNLWIALGVAGILFIVVSYLLSISK